jgi:hypothetical protein
MPVMDKKIGLDGPHSVHWRLECPNCGAKGAPWRRSQLMACGEWESKYHKL